MGGITVLLAGDFHQTLPVVPRGARADEIQSCLKSSFLWPIKNLALTKNMWVHLKGDACTNIFANNLLRIGDGLYKTVDDKITIIYPNILHISKKTLDWVSEVLCEAPRDTASGCAHFSHYLVYYQVEE